MYQLQRISKILIRLTLLLLLLQFVTPTFAHVGIQDNSIHEKNSFKSQQETGIPVSVFLKEISEEQNEVDSKSHVSFELIDFSSHEIVLNQSHAQILSHHGNNQSVSKPRFILFHVFLIWFFSSAASGDPAIHAASVFLHSKELLLTLLKFEFHVWSTGSQSLEI